MIVQTLCVICNKKVGFKPVPLAVTDHQNWACRKCFKNPARREHYYKKVAARIRREERFEELLFGD